MIGNLIENGDYVFEHMDKEDYVTSLYHVSDPSNGGETKYYTGLTSKSFGYLPKQIWCEYRRLTIRWFDKIFHCGESWGGICGCINFNLQNSKGTFPEIWK